MLLQYSILEVMKAWMRVSAAEEESDGLGNVIEVEEGSSGDLVDMMFKWEVIVKDDPEVVTVTEWSCQ